MIGRRSREQDEFFILGSMEQLIPEDHILRRVDAVLDLSWLEEIVADTYTAREGRRSIDPECALRLMLAGFFQGIVHDRALIREAHVNIAIRWFAGFGLQEALPNHSSLTRIRQRWGADRFEMIFKRVVLQCAEAGLVEGETLHVDATLIRANVSWENVVKVHVDKVVEAHEKQEQSPDDNNDDNAQYKADAHNAEQADAKPKRKGAGRKKKAKPKVKRFCKTDPEATVSTSCSTRRMEPCYKHHTAVDDKVGVLVDVKVTTGEASESLELIDQIDRVEQTLGTTIENVTADAGYGKSANYGELERQRKNAVIPPQPQARSAKKIPARRFKYDARHKRVKCPGGKILLPSSRTKNQTIYRAKTKDCQACPMRRRCIAETARARTIAIADDQEALLRARRRRHRWSEEQWRLYQRHQNKVEGWHGEAKNQHGLARAVRRGLENIRIQAYVTGIVMNCKRLVGYGAGKTGKSAGSGLRNGLGAALSTIFARILAKMPGTIPQSDVRRVKFKGAQIWAA